MGIPICADGSGYKIVNGRFLVHVGIRACDLAGSNVDYVRVVAGQEEMAQEAIRRALAKQP